MSFLTRTEFNALADVTLTFNQFLEVRGEGSMCDSGSLDDTGGGDTLKLVRESRKVPPLKAGSRLACRRCKSHWVMLPYELSVPSTLLSDD